MTVSFGCMGGLEIVACQTNETLVVRGTCPVKVRKDRIADMREFVVRADFKTRESIATLYLDAEGRLRCRASMPFDALLIDAEEAMWMLAASVESKILSCEGMDDDYFDMVCYRVDIATRTLVGMCHCPLSLQGDGGHDGIVGLVLDFNLRDDRASLKMDLDAGHLTTQYGMPVSLLRRPRSQSRFRAVATDMTGVPDRALVETYGKLQWILGAKDEACDSQGMQSGAYMAQGRQSK